jgi:hypothetical protein
LRRKVRAEAVVVGVAEEERARASVLVAAARVEYPVEVARALVDLVRVVEGQQEQRVKLAVFGKAAVVQEPPEAV